MAVPTKLPVVPPVRPMLAKSVPSIPEAPEGALLFEPKWDGFRCIVFRDGDDIELGSRNERPLTRYFPELLDPLREALPKRCVVDGEIVIVSADGIDFNALQMRLHPAESRVRKLAGESPASFVAFDLLAIAERSLLDAPLGERRAELEAALADAQPPIHLTPATIDRDVAQDWFVRFEGAGLDGVVAKPVDGVYQPDKRVQFKIKHQRTADCVVAGFRMHKDGAGVGSLLLGLYGDEGDLHHMGVASSFTAARRKELVDEVAPYRENALDGHPWREWAEADAQRVAGGRMPGAPSRWNAGKDLSWEPLRIELVAEVAFERVDAGRFRHSARLLRWRPDRDPPSCTFEQVEVSPPVELALVFGADGGSR